jgi:UDP-2,4-diacetamido-2,4,6-trideoxy-beta-L-altropyranose hydrolase
MKVLFRTNGGKNIGLGHLYRCLSLAKAIKDENKKAEENEDKKIEITFISNKETIELIQKNNYNFISSDKFNKEDIQTIKKQSPDLIIFDSYLANDEYLRKLKEITKLIIFDDNNDIYNSKIPNRIINGNIHAKKLNYSNKETHFLGPKYLVMREEYWNNTTNIINKTMNKSKQEKTLMITTGGADINKIMIKFTKSLKQLKINKKIIIGPAYEEGYIQQIKKEIQNDESYELIYKPKSLKEHIENSNYVLTAAGSTIYEILTLNKIPIIYILADNQKLIAKELERYGTTNLGNYDKIQYDNLKEVIEELTTKEDFKIKELFSLFDGQGAKRIAKEIIGEIEK